MRLAPVLQVLTQDRDIFGSRLCDETSATRLSKVDEGLPHV